MTPLWAPTTPHFHRTSSSGSTTSVYQKPKPSGSSLAITLTRHSPSCFASPSSANLWPNSVGKYWTKNPTRVISTSAIAKRYRGRLRRFGRCQKDAKRILYHSHTSELKKMDISFTHLFTVPQSLFRDVELFEIWYRPTNSGGIRLGESSLNWVGVANVVWPSICWQERRTETGHFHPWIRTFSPCHTLIAVDETVNPRIRFF